jgi:hypothetical protein
VQIHKECKRFGGAAGNQQEDGFSVTSACIYGGTMKLEQVDDESAQ